MTEREFDVSAGPQSQPAPAPAYMGGCEAEEPAPCSCEESVALRAQLTVANAEVERLRGDAQNWMEAWSKNAGHLVAAIAEVERLRAELMQVIGERDIARIDRADAKHALTAANGAHATWQRETVNVQELQIWAHGKTRDQLAAANALLVEAENGHATKPHWRSRVRAHLAKRSGQ